MPEPLSEELREQIRQLAAEGKNNREIARELGINVNTVSKYRDNPVPARSLMPETVDETPAAPTETTPEPVAPGPTPENLAQRLATFGERVLMTSRLAEDVERTFGGGARAIVGAMLAALDADWQQLKGA